VYRARAERVFGFHYRIEIYTPAAARKHGYYVMPVLVGDRLIGRLDLKADRAESRLKVHAAWVEQGVDPRSVAEPVTEELERLASWLGLDEVTISSKGTFAPALRSAHRRSR
jgi:uncharacterized protein YcaQ